MGVSKAASSYSPATGPIGRGGPHARARHATQPHNLGCSSSPAQASTRLEHAADSVQAGGQQRLGARRGRRPRLQRLGRLRLQQAQALGQHRLLKVENEVCEGGVRLAAGSSQRGRGVCIRGECGSHQRSPASRPWAPSSQSCGAQPRAGAHPIPTNKASRPPHLGQGPALPQQLARHAGGGQLQEGALARSAQPRALLLQKSQQACGLRGAACINRQ